ncbi:MAG: glucuronate isomerase [Defluviitaleaceae bacterium]|nr:glucuronate isomerase [Defluviitaleaceae bacterium]
MKPFMDKNFLLNSKTAEALFNQCKDMPIVDYHCHLIPQEIAENKQFTNITDLALRGDHYKWRLMRASGVDEKFITGNGTDEEKFYHWCATIENCIGSPVYHWTHLEMQRYFDYDKPITKDMASKIYDHCNAIINRGDFSAWSIFKKFNVAQIGTTDDPIDDLKYHKQMAEHRAKDASLPLVQPTLRPSNIMNIESPDFIKYIGKLENASGFAIESWRDLQNSLNNRINFFHEMDCRCSDIALDPPVFVPVASEEAVDSILKKAFNGHALNPIEVNQYKTALMLWLGEAFHAKGWVMQLHMGAQRSNNTRMVQKLGADTGYDSMSDETFSSPLAKILDALEAKNALPKTILYGLNPTSDAMLATMIGNFQGNGIKGRMQWGSAWWFNDTKIGMQKHMVTLAECGVLSRFIGMLTDSRSFMSYPRHEYFRRILAQLIAGWVDNGEFPNDTEKLNQIMGDICYRNAVEYFGLEI